MRMRKRQTAKPRQGKTGAGTSSQFWELIHFDKRFFFFFESMRALTENAWLGGEFPSAAGVHRPDDQQTGACK